jgi:thiol-disulfide isomerase/thioredoxin
MNDIALPLMRLFLAAVFGAAGLVKLADRAGARRMLIDFGVPAALAGPLGLLLPIAELTVAAALIATATAWWGAISALAMLLMFMAGIGFNLAWGRRPDCRCFGQLHSAPIGWRTLGRNAALATGAAFVIVQRRESAGSSAISWLADLTPVQTVSLLIGTGVLGLLSVEGWLLVHLLRQNGRLLLRMEALEGRLASGPDQNWPGQQPSGLLPGAPAPAFDLVSVRGERHTLDALRGAGKPIILIFSDPNCEACTALLPEIGRWQHDYANALSIVLIIRGGRVSKGAKIATSDLTEILLQQDSEVARDYLVSVTPSAVVVYPDGKIGSPLIEGADGIRATVAHMLKLTPRVPALNTPAPALKLPDLMGKMIDLVEFRGRPTLVLFWNPNCGFCQRMLPDLKAWEAHLPEEASKLVIVSTGSVEANYAMGIRSPVVLDQAFMVGRAFGATGTPTAVLVDALGNIASNIATGAQAVMELANSLSNGLSSELNLVTSAKVVADWGNGH